MCALRPRRGAETSPIVSVDASGVLTGWTPQKMSPITAHSGPFGQLTALPASTNRGVYSGARSVKFGSFQKLGQIPLVHKRTRNSYNLSLPSSTPGCVTGHHTCYRLGVVLGTPLSLSLHCLCHSISLRGTLDTVTPYQFSHGQCAPGQR